jgi:leader peptidase (prepilin peptidase)/N-methyltransferase
VALLLVLLGVLGLTIGSFLNVVIHRVPLGLSLVAPASRCPLCEHPIRTRHNLPVIGWLLLGGRCADCRSRIPMRYPMVELLTGVLFVLVAWRALQMGQSAALPALLTFTSFGVALAGIDLAERRLPNVVLLPAYPVLAVLVVAACGIRSEWWPLARAGIGAVALFAFFVALALASPRSMGLGDVKLAGVIGLVLGYLSWRALLVGTFAGFVLGAVVGLLIIATRRGDRQTAIPFGPFMVAGSLLALWIATPVIELIVPT